MFTSHALGSIHNYIMLFMYVHIHVYGNYGYLCTQILFNTTASVKGLYAEYIVIQK